jgi:hypothetical protein
MEVAGSVGLESVGVHGIWVAIFFTRQQHAIMIDNVGVYHGPDGEFNGISVFVTISARKRTSCCSLLSQFFCVDVSLFEVHKAILDSEGTDDAISVKPLS